MSNDYSFVGADPGSIGVVTVDGAGSTWTTAGEFYLGQSGNGTLTVRNGGTLSSDVSYIGSDTDLDGHRDSRWRRLDLDQQLGFVCRLYRQRHPEHPQRRQW